MNKEKIQYKNTEKFTQEVIDEVLEVQKTYGLTPENLLKKRVKNPVRYMNFLIGIILLQVRSGDFNKQGVLSMR